MIVIDIELLQDRPDDEGEPWDRTLLIDRDTVNGNAWLTIHDNDTDDESAVILTPQRARDIALMLATWADTRDALDGGKVLADPVSP